MGQCQSHSLYSTHSKAWSQLVGDDSDIEVHVTFSIVAKLISLRPSLLIETLMLALSIKIGHSHTANTGSPRHTLQSPTLRLKKDQSLFQRIKFQVSLANLSREDCNFEFLDGSLSTQQITCNSRLDDIV